MSVAATCGCGNAATTECDDCQGPVCALCVRTESARKTCLKCRTGAIKRDELRALEARRPVSGAAPAARGRRVRRTWIVVPATLTAILALLAAFVVPLLDAAGSQGERRAQAQLLAIAEAEARFRAESPGKARYGTLGELLERRVLAPFDVPSHDVRLDVSSDGKRFWARAIPRDGSGRILCVDERGRVVIESETGSPAPPGKR